MAAAKHTTPTQLDLSFTPDEEWRPVVGYEGLYEVSNLGRVRGLTRQVAAVHQSGRSVVHRTLGRVLRQFTNTRVLAHGIKDCYKRVTLSQEGKRQHFMVHILVLEAFVGPQPSGYQCNHRDGNTGNNCVTNLEWCTPRDNMLHAVRTGLNPRSYGEKNALSKLTTADVLAIRACITEGMTPTQIAQQFGTKPGNIWHIKQRKTWKHLP